MRPDGVSRSSRRSIGASLSLRMPLRFLRTGWLRVARTVVALGCGVAMVAAVQLANAAVLRAFTEVVDTMAGRAALSVSAGADGVFPETAVGTVAAVAGVERAVPVVGGKAFRADGTGELLTVQAIDLGSDDAVRVYEARDDGGMRIDDPLLFLVSAIPSR